LIIYELKKGHIIGSFFFYKVTLTKDLCLGMIEDFLRQNLPQISILARWFFDKSPQCSAIFLNPTFPDQ